MRGSMMIGVWTFLLVVTTVGPVTSIHGDMMELLPVLVPAPGFYLTVPSSGEPLITLEFFMDLTCPTSRYSWGPALAMSKHYSADQVAVKIYMYPLPYHRNAMLASQGLLLLRQKMPAMAQDYISMVFDHLEEFTTWATANQTESQVMEQLANYTEQLTGLPLFDILTNIHDYNHAVRNEWKLGASRGVAETPTIFINGIQVYFSDITIEDLKSMMDRLLEGATHGVGSTLGSTTVGPMTVVHGEMMELLPVLAPAPGFYLIAPSSSEPVITLEFFLDLICPDSRIVWGPALALSQHYSADQVAVRIYMYPLPYHRNAMLASQGLLLLRQKMPAMAQDYISMVFDHLEEFTTRATANQTESQVMELLANYIEQLTGLPLSNILTNIHSYNRAVRNEWKLGASRGVAKTPTVIVNGIQVNFSDITIDGLKSMLDRHLEGATHGVGSTSGSSSLPPDVKSGSFAASSATSVFKFW